MYIVYAVIRKPGSTDETLYQLGQLDTEAIPKSDQVEGLVTGNSDELNRLLTGTPPTTLVGYRVYDEHGNNVSPAIARQEYEGGRYVERSMKDGMEK